MRFVKSLLASALFATSIVTAIPTSVSAEEPISVFFDQEKMNFEVPPLIQDGTTLVQFRTIFEKLGYSVKWNQDNRSVIASKDGMTIVLYIDIKKALVNNKEVTLEKASSIINGSTMIPLRFVSETSGKTVVWSGKTRTISIVGEAKPTTTEPTSPTPAPAPEPEPTPTPAPEPEATITGLGSGYRNFVKKDGKVYLLDTSPHLFKDNSNNFYLDEYGFLVGLMRIYYNHFTIKPSNYPNVDGFIEVKGGSQYISVRDDIRSETDWDTFTVIHSEDKTKQYEYSAKSKKGLVVMNNRSSFLPMSLILQQLDINCTIQIDEQNKKVYYTM